jgi:hypothetical protein
MLADGTGGNGSTEPSVGAAVSSGAAFAIDMHDTIANAVGRIHRVNVSVILRYLIIKYSPTSLAPDTGKRTYFVNTAMFVVPAIERRHFPVLVGEQQTQDRAERNAPLTE